MKTMQTDYGSFSGARREALKREVFSLLEKAGEKGWDGEGAAKLEVETVGIAQGLIDLFPDDAVLSEFLDVDVTPQGEVDFGWVVDRNVMLIVSVLPSRDIAFAGSFHNATLNGCEPWQGVLPQFVQCCFERLGSS